MQSSRYLKLLAQAIALCAINPTAFSQDSEPLPVTWNHDGEMRVFIEGELRIMDMEENVTVTQGDIVIKGDEARFEYAAATDELIRVTVRGTPVNYQQATDPGEDSPSDVTGTSETLIMYTDETTQETIVEMIGDAYIESPDSTMRCASIIYITESDLIREATGPCQGALSSSSN